MRRFRCQIAGLRGRGCCVGYGGVGMLWGDVGVHMGLIVGNGSSLGRSIALRVENVEVGHDSAAFGVVSLAIVTVVIVAVVGLVLVGA